MTVSRLFTSLFLLIIFIIPAHAGPTFHRPHQHELSITLDPEDKTADITDTSALDR